MGDYTKHRDRPRTLAKLTLAGYDDRTIGKLMHIAPHTVANLRRSKMFKAALAEFQHITDQAAINLALARLAGLPTDVPERIIQEFYGIGRPMSVRIRRRVANPRSLQRVRLAREQAALDAAGSGGQDTIPAKPAHQETPEDIESKEDNA